jgi:hypothetical protein
MITIKEEWDENHGAAWAQAWENDYLIDEEYFSVGHGASADNRGIAHEILWNRIRRARPAARIKSFWNGAIYG